MIEEYTVAGIGRGIYGLGPESEDLGCVEHEKFLAEVDLRSVDCRQCSVAPV